MTLLQYSMHIADKHRMILSGEYPDYIHAVAANVSLLIITFITYCMQWIRIANKLCIYSTTILFAIHFLTHNLCII